MRTSSKGTDLLSNLSKNYEELSDEYLRTIWIKSSVILIKFYDAL